MGKTTTLAKLGAYFGIFQKKRVKFVSIDNYRVGAAQQLKLYAEIMDIPFDKANTLDEFRDSLPKNEAGKILKAKLIKECKSK